MNYDEAIVIFRALGDRNRLQIVRELSAGERCACSLLSLFQFSQPTLSHHIKILTDCGLVVVRKEGKRRFYSISEDVLKGFKMHIAEFKSESWHGVCTNEDCKSKENCEHRK